ncbi:MAG: amidohydrolase family protein [Deltaproteobacteria bacterium]|nr:amidohydrolase family protein [Deltaproteobacteria bacterium]MBW2065868.1 amidohydrolase family protein [Deltaproteobacteria bacterium]
MKIDIFCHVTPPKYLRALERKVTSEVAKSLPSRNLPALSDFEVRFRIMDHYPDMRQVLTITNPPVESILEPKDAIEVSKIGNDELAELVLKYPDRFVGGVACLPMNDMDAALEEVDRAIEELGLNGVQIFTNIMGKQLDSPEFMPLYEKMAQHDLPIWIHPFFKSIGAVAKDKDQFSGYRVFTGKEDHAWAMDRAAFEMPGSSSTAMTRLVYSGVFDKYPNIKFITHHCGSSVPYFIKRIEMHYLMFKEVEKVDLGLKRPVPEYYRMFYGDTALHGNVPALMCGYHYFGAEHILFGTDMPFGSESGLWPVRQTVDSVEKMEITDEERKKIFEDNARRLLRLSL